MGNTLFPDIETEREKLSGFAEFRAAYPSEGWAHTDRAKMAWARLCPSPELQKKILAALAIQKVSERWADPQFIPNPASYLNARYFDEDMKRYPRRKAAAADLCPKCGHRMKAHMHGCMDCWNVEDRGCRYG